MRDARGRTIRAGDTIVYATSGGVTSVNAAVVTAVEKGRVRARVVSKTEYGTAPGKEVALGDGGSHPMERVMVVAGADEPVPLEGGTVRRQT